MNGPSMLEEIYSKQQGFTLENRKDQKQSSRKQYSTCVASLILGVLFGSLALAVILAIYLTGRGSSTNISSSLSTARSTTTTTESTTTSTTSTTTPLSLNLWNLTGNMSVPRTYHTSTYIPETNSVLLTGGSGQLTTETVNVVTGSFTLRGNLTRIRSYHTADRLSSGVVLIAGGSSNAVADIYDPILGMVTGTVAMTVARSRHTSSVIEIGSTKKVLLAGGQGTIGSTGDVYDTATGLFSPTSNNMSVPRLAHTATAVPGGLVIIAGGRNGSAELDTLELYNSSSNSFMALPARMSVRRYEHIATYIPSIQSILIAGGWTSAFGFLQSYDLFHVPSLSFIQLNGTMLKRREWFASTLLLDGRVLLVGGSDGTGHQNSCEIYNPATNNFTLATNMTYIRGWHPATLITSSGQVMVCGGVGSTETPRTCELYTP